MNASDQKLRNAFAFRLARERGRFVECGGFRLYCAAYAERAPGLSRRFGVVASQKSVGDAVRRNRAKRVFRALWRAHAGALPPLCDAAVFVRAAYAREDHAALSARFAKACADLAAHFEKKPSARLPGEVAARSAAPPKPSARAPRASHAG